MTTPVDQARRHGLVRRLAALVPLVVWLLPVEAGPAGAQSVTQEFEVSDSCVAVGQRIPALTVWGSGFDAWFGAGYRLDVEWHWGGEPSTPQPAQVLPASQQAMGPSFTMAFDVTGYSPASTAFGAIINNQSRTGSPTLVDTVDLDVADTCPSGSGTCVVDQGAPVLQVETHGYPTDWSYEFLYQYHQPNQAGPSTGAVGIDGAVHGEFRGLQQSASPTVTARVYQPAVGDFSGKTYFVTFPVPVCTLTTTTTTTTTTSTTATTGPSSSTTTTAGTSSTATTATTSGPTTTSSPSPSPFFPTRPGAGGEAIPAPAFTPTMAVSPTVGHDGAVVTISGAGFPPEVDVTLTWRPGTGSVRAHTDPGGKFVVGMLVLPRDTAGWRLAVASDYPGAAAPFLVELGTARPPQPHASPGGGGPLFR